jgi:hypothetical protein
MDSIAGVLGDFCKKVLISRGIIREFMSSWPACANAVLCVNFDS